MLFAPTWILGCKRARYRRISTRFHLIWKRWMSTTDPMQWNISFCNRNLHVIHYVIYNICIIITAMHVYIWSKKLCWIGDISFVGIATAHTYEEKIIIKCRKRDTAFFFKKQHIAYLENIRRDMHTYPKQDLNNAQRLYIINTKTVTMY